MSHLSRAITLGLIVGISGLVISLTPPGFKLEENLGLSLLFKLRGSRQAPPEVIVVAIDKASANQLNLDEHPKKWPRSLHARLTESLSGKGASVIAFDLFFNEPRSPEEDVLFAKAIGSAENVVLGEYLKQEVLIDSRGQAMENFHAEKHLLPIPSLAQPAVAVASFPLPKYPHRVNQYWTFKAAAGNVPTLPVVAFQIFALDSYESFIREIGRYESHQKDTLPQNKDAMVNSGNFINIMKRIRIIFEKDPSLKDKIARNMSNADESPYESEKARTIQSLSRMYQSANTHYLNFYGPPRTITTVPYYHVIQPNEIPLDNGEQPDFRGKAVFVGLSENIPSERRNDSFYTVYSQANGVDISGVEIAATAFANILENMHIKPLSIYKQFAIIFSGGLILAVLIYHLFPAVISPRKMILRILSLLLIGILYLIFTLYRFKSGGIWYPLVIPLFQIPVAFIGLIVMRNIITERTGYGIYLFTDIRGFTKFSEDMDPRHLKNLMTEYFEPLFRIVERYGGTMETVPGDAMLARWEVKGSGTESIKQKKQACLAALDIAGEIFRFIQSSDEQLHTRIGLHSGLTSRGIIGSRYQLKNITFGDTVNTAQRVEELNKCLGTKILLSEEMLSQVDGFLTREVGKFVLAGKSKPIILHELICPAKEASPDQKDLCLLFTDALRSFERQSWEEASGSFNKIISRFGQDGPSLYYSGLSESYKNKPPEETWSGAVCMDKT